MTDAEFNRLAGEVLRGNHDARGRLFRWVYEQALIYVKWKSKTYKQLQHIERFEDAALDLLLMFAERLHRLDNPAHYLKVLIKFETLRAGKKNERYRMAMLISDYLVEYLVGEKDFPDESWYTDQPKIHHLCEIPFAEQDEPPLDDDDLLRMRAAAHVHDNSSELLQTCIRLRLRGMKFREIAAGTDYKNTESAGASFSAYRQKVKQRYREIAA